MRLCWVMLATVLSYLMLVVPASQRNSPTFDEQAHIRSGLAMLTGGNYVETQQAWWTALDPLHPPADILPAAAAMLSGLSADQRQSATISFSSILAARTANYLVGTLCILLLLHWGYSLFGWAGCVSGVVATLGNPLFLAHAMIVSSDLYMAFGALTACWFLWRTTERRTFSLANAGILGVLLGLAICSKLSAIVVLPFAAAAVWYRGGSWWFTVVTIVVATCFAVGIYELSHRSLLLPNDLVVPSRMLYALDVSRGLSATLPEIYWFGEYVPGSWKQYVVVLAARTPVLLLSFLSVGLIASLRYPRVRVLGLLALGAAIFFSTRGFYLGLRHLLFPILLLTLLAGAVLQKVQLSKRLAAVVVVLVSTLHWRLFPWYLSYTNPLVEEELTFVADGDWGQGLFELRSLSNDQLWLSYFGSYSPEAVGVVYRGLRTAFNSHPFDKAGKRYFDPSRASGTVAISAGNLAGRYLPSVGIDRNYYEQWRSRTPTRIVGRSIYLFDTVGDKESS